MKKTQSSDCINDFDREVYCLLGLAVDAVNMETAADKVRSAALHETPYLIATPNVNFLINSQCNAEFREAVLNSDLCVADGMPLIWLARLLGVPLPERVAGSDLFERLKIKSQDAENQEPLSVFFFGGEEGAGKKACDALNLQVGNVICAGSLDPGFVSLEEMSSDKIISEINDSGADFLVVALGAVKGHIWLERNKDNLRIPVRSHLGAVINFEAGGIVRSPGIVSRLGFEWLWRIKEEPKLWRRYWSDGVALAALMFTRVLPLVGWNFRMRYLAEKREPAFAATRKTEGNRTIISLSGYADYEKLDEIRKYFQSTANFQLETVLDFSGLSHIDAAVLGAVLMLKKELQQKNVILKITGDNAEIRRLFKWHRVDFLLKDKNGPV